MILTLFSSIHTCYTFSSRLFGLLPLAVSLLSICLVLTGRFFHSIYHFFSSSSLPRQPSFSLSRWFLLMQSLFFLVCCDFILPVCQCPVCSSVSLCLSVCLSVSLHVSLYVCLSVCLHVCLSVCHFVCLSVILCLSICLPSYMYSVSVT